MFGRSVTVLYWSKKLVASLFLASLFLGMVQKRPFSGNTWALSVDPERSCVGAG